MTRKKLYWEEIGVSAELSLFNPEGLTDEIHAILHVEARDEDFCGQLSRLSRGQSLLSSLPEMSGCHAVFKR